MELNILRKCKCGDTFRPVTKRQRFCSAVCQARKNVLTCEACGRTFEACRADAKCCSRRCMIVLLQSNVIEKEESLNLGSNINPDVYSPTGAPPGSAEKIEVLAQRFENGCPLYHPHDRTDFSGVTNKARIA